MVTQTIVGIVQKNPNEAITHDIWVAISQKMKDWLEVSSKHKQKIKLELIFRSIEPKTFSLVSEVYQHDEFTAGNLAQVDIARRTGTEQLNLARRLDHAEKSIKPVILEVLSAKRSPKRSSKVRISIGSGVCRWVEKISGVETDTPED